MLLTLESKRKQNLSDPTWDIAQGWASEALAGFTAPSHSHALA